MEPNNQQFSNIVSLSDKRKEVEDANRKENEFGPILKGIVKRKDAE